jgi:hypothetical protein
MSIEQQSSVRYQSGEADPARSASVRRSAWVLAAVVVAIYVGYIAWNLIVVAGGQ